jgi:DNA-binding MarR family transcriptional regulator
MKLKTQSITEYLDAQLPPPIMTSALISDSALQTLRTLAADRGERLPALIGRLAEFALAQMTNDVGESAVPELRLVNAPLNATTLQTVAAMIAASRFPGETGSMRARLVALIYIIAAHIAQNKHPTTAHLSDTLDASKAIIHRLVKLLVTRGVIVRQRGRQARGAAPLLLSFSSDPLSALNRAHRAATGSEIDMTPIRLQIEGGSKTAQATQDLPALVAALAGARFPEDTGSTRARQIAVVLAVQSANDCGSNPTSASIAREFNAQPSVISRLVKTLRDRGVLIIVPGASGGRANNLAIAPHARKALEASHVIETGGQISL